MCFYKGPLIKLLVFQSAQKFPFGIGRLVVFDAFRGPALVLESCVTWEVPWQITSGGLGFGGLVLRSGAARKPGPVRYEFLF